MARHWTSGKSWGEVDTTPVGTKAGLKVNRRRVAKETPQAFGVPAFDWRCHGCKKEILVGESFHKSTVAGKTTLSANGQMIRCAACCNDGKGRGTHGKPLAQSNPKLGKHPDLYETYKRGYQAEDTDVVAEDWRDCSPDELRNAAENGELSEDDYAEMEGYENEDTTAGDLDPVLQDAIYEGLRTECLELDEAGQENRIAPFVNEIRGWMASWLKEEFGDEDGNGPNVESFVDQFQNALEADAGEIGLDTLTRAAEETSALGKKVITEGLLDDEVLDEILRDPGLYDVVRKDDEYRRVPGSVWSYSCGVKEDQLDNSHVDGVISAMLHGGEHEHHAWGDARDAFQRGDVAEAERLQAIGEGRARVETVQYPGMTNEDLRAALKELDNGDPDVRITLWAGRRGVKNVKHLDSSRSGPDGVDGFTIDDLDNGFDMSSHKYEGSRVHAILDAERLDAILNEKVAGEAPKRGREHDDIAYEYTGTNTSVAGASARDMYVARLTAKDLRHESAVLGHCIGAEQHGHPKALREGRTQVFSIRTEVGKPKFTIELTKSSYDTHVGTTQDSSGAWWSVAEIKGKANRLPGFEAGADRSDGKGFSKPDDLRLVTDFLLHLGYTPEYLRTVQDIAPGIKAMEEKGVDPFSPPPKRVRAPRENPARVSAAVRRLLEKTRPMGAFRSSATPGRAVMSDEDAELLRIKGLCLCGHGRAVHTARGCEECRKVSLTQCPRFFSTTRSNPSAILDIANNAYDLLPQFNSSFAREDWDNFVDYCREAWMSLPVDSILQNAMTVQWEDEVVALVCKNSHVYAELQLDGMPARWGCVVSSEHSTDDLGTFHSREAATSAGDDWFVNNLDGDDPDDTEIGYEVIDHADFVGRMHEPASVHFMYAHPSDDANTPGSTHARADEMRATGRWEPNASLMSADAHSWVFIGRKPWTEDEDEDEDV